MLVSPGKYLTEFCKDPSFPQAISLCDPSPGLVIQDWIDNDMKLILVFDGETSTKIFANEKAIKKL